MTTVNETPERQAPKARKVPSKWDGIISGIIATLGTWAFLAWLAGVGLGRGFGVSVPFIPALILALVFGGVVKSLLSMAADTWHAARVKADTAFLAAHMAVQAQLQDASQADMAKLFADLGMDKPAPGAGGSGYP